MEATFKLNGKDLGPYQVLGLDLHIRISSPFILSFALSIVPGRVEDPLQLTIHEQAEIAARGLAGEQSGSISNVATKSIEVFPIRFSKGSISRGKSQAGADDTAVVVLHVDALLVSQDLLRWFSLAHDDSALLYQRAADETGWQFFNRIAAQRFDNLGQRFPETGPVSPGNFSDYLFPTHAVLPRPPGISNREYLDCVLGFLRSRVPGILGWMANATQNMPLRLAGFYPDIASADLGQRTDGWEVLELQPPGTDKSEALSIVTNFKCDDAFEFLSALIKNFDFVFTWNDQDLPVFPGPVRFLGSTFYAAAIDYSLIREDGPSRCTIRLERRLSPTASQPMFPSMIQGTVIAWATLKDSTGQQPWLSFDPNGLGHGCMSRWTTAGTVPNGGDFPSDKPPALLSHLAVPGFVRPGDQGFSGLYFSFKANDRLAIMITPGEPPLAIGALQTFHQEFDEGTCVLNVPSLRLQVSAASSKGDEVRHVSLTPESLVVSPKDVVSVTAQKTVISKALTITENSVELKGDLAISANLSVGGES